MSKQEKSLILLNSVFNFCASLISTFINVYLYIYTSSIPMMCLYTMIRIACYPIFFIIGTKLVKKYPFTLTYTIGLSLITCSLIFALAGASLFEQNPYYVLIAAFIIGSGEGFYYFSANSCIQLVPNEETLGKFFVFNGIFSTIASILAPGFATLILNSVADEVKGYRILLYVIVIVFVVVIFIALNINVYSKDKNSSVIKALDIKHDKKWRDHNFAFFFHSLEDGLRLNTINLLIYQAAGSSGVYSKTQTLFSFISILAYFSTRRLLTKEHISITMTLGLIFRITCNLILLYLSNLTGAIIYGLMNTFACAFNDNSVSFMSSYIINDYKEEMTARVVVRQIYTTFGRIASMGFVLLCYMLLPENIYLLVSVTVLSFGPLFAGKLLLKYKD